MPSTENQNISIEDFMKYIADYLSPKQVAKVQKAYDFAARVHADQKRRSGEPYIIHPTQVAYILAQMKMDDETLCAAFLHDTVEDTDYSLQQLTEDYDEAGGSEDSRPTLARWVPEAALAAAREEGRREGWLDRAGGAPRGARDIRNR